MSTTASVDVLYSRLAGDPVLGEIVRLYAEEMPERLALLHEHCRARNWPELARVAHQLKGSSGGYGFDALTPLAARLEQAAKNAASEIEIRVALAEFEAVARRIRGDQPTVN